MVFRTSRFGIVAKLAICVVLALTATAALGASGFTSQHRLGSTSGDQWEPALAADAHGRVYVLVPQYGPVAQCPLCTSPTMVLMTSSDNGNSWDAPRPLLTSSSGQFDAHASCNRTCELGMTRATGVPYRHVIEVLAELTGTTPP